MNPEEQTVELETTPDADVDQITADDTEAQEASEQEQADAHDDEPEQPGEDSEPTITATVDGEERQLSRSEIEKGYMRDKAFTQKSQAQAEERRQRDAAFEQQVTSIRETLGREVEQAKSWLEFYQANQPAKPNFSAISREKGPAIAQQAMFDWQDQQDKLVTVKEHYAQIKDQERQVAEKAKVQDGERFLQEMQTEFPEWAVDDNRADRELAEIWITAGAYGFDRDDIIAAQNPKIFKVLKDAAEFRKLQAKTTEIKARVAAVPIKPPVRTIAAQKPGRDMLKDLASKPTIANAMKLDF